MQQVRLVTGSVVTKPLVDIHYADLMEHREPVTRSLAFIGDDRGNQILIHGRSILPANFKQSRIYVPLDGVSKEMRQQKQSLVRSDRVVHIDFRTVQIPCERIGDITSHNADSIDVLEMLLDSRGIFIERSFHRSIVCNGYALATRSFDRSAALMRRSLYWPVGSRIREIAHQECATCSRRSAHCSRCFVESDSANAAVPITSPQGWQTSPTRPCVSRRYSVCNAQWDSLGDAAAGDGLRLR